MRRSLFGATLALSLAAATGARQQVIGIAVGTKAPGAVVQTLDGKNVDLASYLGRKPVVLEFWATWCENCKALEPSVLALAKQYEGKVQFVGVAVSVNQSPERVAKYIAKNGYSYPVVYDTHGNATEAYEVPATSYVVIVDKTGIIVYTGVGGDQDLTAALKKLHM